MLRHARVRPSSITIRRCLACGYGGRISRGSIHHDEFDVHDECDAHDVLSGLPRCPRCGCDFHVRPPRSYAEMEGLESVEDGDRRDALAARETRMVERWIGFLFLAVLACVIATSLVAAAVAPLEPFGG